MSQLVFDAVSVRVRSRELLSGVTLALESGEFLAVLGPNGAGKTTLLRAAIGLLRPASGVVSIGNEPVAGLSSRRRAAELAWLPQQPLTPEPIPALEAVLAARYRFAETAAKARSAALGALERVGLGSSARALLTELSGGERQRVAIAALLAQEAHFLLLDEPANHLDPARQAETYALLGSVLGAGVGILCVTHDVNLLVHVPGSPRVAGLAEGTLRFDTHFAASELPERMSELFGLPMHTALVGSERLILPAPGRRRGEAP